MAECGNGRYIGTNYECQRPPGSNEKLRVNRNIGDIWDHLDAEPATGNIELYVYIVDSVKPHGNSLTGYTFQQRGSGPNFQGGQITLCTCKHQMRSCKHDISAWKNNVWIAGFTGRAEKGFDGKNWLFYLMKVGKSFSTHKELAEYFTKCLSPQVLEAKRADKNYLGDLFVPRGKSEGASPNSWLEPSNYIAPKVGKHSHCMPGNPSHWEWDICSEYWGRNPALLLGEADKSFLWLDPTIWYSEPLPRTKKFSGKDEVNVFLNNS